MPGEMCKELHIEECFAYRIIVTVTLTAHVAMYIEPLENTWNIIPFRPTLLQKEKT
jgi:hypothetical protein